MQLAPIEWTNYVTEDSNKFENAKMHALDAGFEIVGGNESTLLLDLDTESAYQQYQQMIPMVREHFGSFDVREWKSKSGNRHIQLVFAGLNLTVPERLVLQSVLGSDPKHELLSLLGYRNGVEDPIMLFKPGSLRQGAAAQGVEEEVPF